MKPLVYLEPTSSGVPLRAAWIRALEGLLACVGELVRLQVPLGDELLVALCAHKRPFPGVRPHVRFEVASL
jgi:hypothetical protein